MNLWRDYVNWVDLDWSSLCWPSKLLICYGLLMVIALVVTYAWSFNDPRAIREVGVWVKPMKFMAATALFAFTSIWVLRVADSRLDQLNVFAWIVGLIVTTSLFEVAYISYQASQAAASHYNVSDPFHALMFGVMGLAAVGLTASQAWIAWEIWKEQGFTNMSTATWGVVIGLLLTFILSTISGFMLGGNQPPAGQGLPIVGWHLQKDIRPAHFLGVHAQQLIPVWGLIAVKFMGTFATTGLFIGSFVYVTLWAVTTWLSL